MNMKDDIKKLVIEYLDKNVFLSAGAGTGKTQALVQRFIELLYNKKAEVPEIVAITFTEKAAKEMKDRIRDECTKREVLDPVWGKYKRDLENSRIGTIHGFCARLIRENPIEVGIDPASEVLDETEGFTLLDKFVHRNILEKLEKENKDIVTLISTYGFKETKRILKSIIKNRIDIDIIKKGFFEMDEKTLLEHFGKENENPSDMDIKAIEINKHIFSVYEDMKNEYEDYKKKEGLLDFDDLIIYTKWLLKTNKSVRRYYQRIIKYILVDEYQDTDFNQKEIIFYIAEDPAITMADRMEDVILSKNKLFIVGDNKQSIYRFRGADVSVFEDTKRILKKCGESLTLNVNMRTIPKNIKFFNDMFGKMMGKDKNKKEDYEAIYTDILPSRDTIPEMPTVEFLSVPYDEEDTARDIRNKEADLIAKRIINMVGKETLVYPAPQCASGDGVHDPSPREVQFKDIAVLFRAMTDVKIYENAFRKCNIPYYIIAGSGFFARQEIKDVLNYLKIIEDDKDSVAMVGVMRSPMVGISDNALFWIRQDPLLHAKAGKVRGENIPKAEMEKIESFKRDLTALRELKDRIPISHLIQRIIELTDYRTILSAQYMGEQRISNINKLIDAARNFERKGIFSLVDFIDYIDDLVVNEAREGEATISEEESNVVKIMTIHKAKGLEFPVVIIPDVSRGSRPSWDPVLYDKKYTGLGIRVKDKDGEFTDSTLRTLIKEEIDKKDFAESKRLFYVASTRVRDYLIYSGKFEEKNNTWANWLIEYFNTDKIKIITHIPESKPISPARTITKSVSLSASNILQQTEPVPIYPKNRVTATEFSDYIKHKSMQPSEKILEIPELNTAIKIGIETHDFFKQWDFNQEKMPSDENIRKFIINFVNNPIYKEIKSAIEIKKEIPIIYKHNSYIIEGVIDLLYKKEDGNWVIIDYKTDGIREDEIPERVKYYEIQLQVYAFGIQRILGVLPEKLVIFFLSPSVAYTIKPEDKKWVESIKKKLDDLIPHITSL